MILSLMIYAIPLFLLVALPSASALDALPSASALVLQEENYLIVNLQLNWHAAFMFCRRLNADLLTIGSSEEQRVVEQLILNAGMEWVERFWMAGTDLHAQGEWTWMTSGRPMRPYTNWAPGEPNNANGNEHCVGAQPSRYDPRMFRWNDVRCDWRSYFICEMFDTEYNETIGIDQIIP